MQTLEPPKKYTKVFSSGFVTNEMYLMAGKSLSKYDYQKCGRWPPMTVKEGNSYD